MSAESLTRRQESCPVVQPAKDQYVDRSVSSVYDDSKQLASELNERTVHGRRGIPRLLLVLEVDGVQEALLKIIIINEFLPRPNEASLDLQGRLVAMYAPPPFHFFLPTPVLTPPPSLSSSASSSLGIACGSSGLSLCRFDYHIALARLYSLQELCGVCSTHDHRLLCV